MGFSDKKTVLNRGIRAISRAKTRVKPGTMLIETVLSGDSLYLIKSTFLWMNRLLFPWIGFQLMCL